MSEYADFLPAATGAVDIASRVMTAHEVGTLVAKGHRDMATDADYRIEREVRAYLAKATPGIAFLGEEEGWRGRSGEQGVGEQGASQPDHEDELGREGELAWILDPIDGTANFVHGSPLCGVSLGLVCGTRAVLGVIGLPFLGHTYCAVDHQGAYADGHRLRASHTDQLTDAIVAVGDFAVGDGATSRNRLRFAVARRLAASVQRVRIHGSIALDLAWLAEGRIDAAVTLSNKPWDTTAGVVIAREAGVRMVDLHGAEHSLESAVTVGAGDRLLADLLGLLAEAARDAESAEGHASAESEETG